MRSIILYCPHLGRDISGLREATDAEIMLGEPTERGEDGCLEMHKAAVRSAMEQGDPSVFVMEDDCAFTEAFSPERWEEQARIAEAFAFDVLVGGSTRTYDERLIGLGGLVEVSAFHSAHCVVYFASGYEKILRAVQPFDLSLGRDCGCKIALAWPFVAVQRPSYSGILRQPVDYVPLYQQHEQELRRMLIS